MKGDTVSVNLMRTEKENFVFVMSACLRLDWFKMLSFVGKTWLLSNVAHARKTLCVGTTLFACEKMSSADSLFGVNDVVLKKKVLSMHEHYDLENVTGTKLGEADGNLIQFPAKFTVKDTNGSELMRLEGKRFSLRKQFTIYDNAGAELGTIQKKIVKLIGEEYWVEKNGVEFMRIYGNFTEHDYQMQVNGVQVASVHKKWFSVRDQLGVSITGEIDHRVVIGAVIVIEHIEVTERQRQHQT